MANGPITLAIASISWIKAEPNPLRNWFVRGTQALTLDPDWIPKTYVGLYATRNSAPPDQLADTDKFKKSKDYRAFTFAQITLNGEDPLDAPQLDKMDLDPGYTPPFRWTSVPGGITKGSTWSWQYPPGEKNTASTVYVRRAHPHSTIKVAAGDEILLSTLIKFRAGEHTDKLGIDEVGAPNHVPWVWCETMLAYVRNTNQYVVYSNASKFPTHFWYCGRDGNLARCATQPEDSDTKFPVKANAKSQIETAGLRLYPMLVAGAPAGGPQTPIDEDATSTAPINLHKNTADYGPGQQRVVVTL